MKKLFVKIVQLRNPQFQLDEAVSGWLLFLFIRQQLFALLRGCLSLLSLRHPKWMLRGKGVQFFNMPQMKWGRMLKLGDHVFMSALGKGKIALGNNVSIGSFSRVIISTSLNHLGAAIVIGNNVGIGEFAYLGGGGGLQIGDDCIVGQYFSCHPENHVHSDGALLIRNQGVTRKGIRIDRNCWVGSKVTILDGVHIGEGCVIAAGSVVSKSFPAHCVIGGVPAKILRMRAVADDRELAGIQTEKIY